jgi:exopolyphosphatase/guanosine-5'-triphosphate,3'-diphosphate pyrophosphatase
LGSIGHAKDRKSMSVSTPEQRIAAFDLGSNSIKMTIASVTADGKVDESIWMTKAVRLGEGIDRNGVLADDRIAAALEALQEMSDRATQESVTKKIGVATEAVRIAGNGAQFLKTIEDRFGITIALISGDEEASLAYVGLAATMTLEGPIVMADIGGASTEIVSANGDDISLSISMPLGSGRLTDRLVTENPPTMESLHACHDAARSVLAPLDLDKRQGAQLIITGGTGEYMGRLIGKSDDIRPTEVNGALRRLTKITAEDLATEIDIQIARAKVLPAGIAIVAALCELIEPSKVTGARSGIRTGMLLAAARGTWK